MGDNVYIDDNLNCSDEPTAIRPDINSAQIEVVIPDVEITGETPALYQDQDSVSTFRSKKPKKANVSRVSSDSTMSVKFSPTAKVSAIPASTPTNADKDKDDDGSISKMSDTASRLSFFEARFNSVTVEFTKEQAEQRAMLTSIMELLKVSAVNFQPSILANTANVADPPQSSVIINTEADSRQSPTTSDKANHLAQKDSSGGSNGAAGNGS